MSARKQEQRRARIAIEAARLMSEQAIRDFQLAKKKAAQSLGVSDKYDMPANQEIEQAIRDYQSIFCTTTQPKALSALRQTALDAMHFFADFQPRLVGDVLSGVANRHAVISLHLFADYPEQVSIFLMDNDIPFEEKNRRLRVSADQYRVYPQFGFTADDTEIELIVFARADIRTAPLSVVDGKPMQRAALKAVRLLMQDE